MIKKIFLFSFAFLASIFFANSVNAANFNISPATGDLVAMGSVGCSKIIDVFINTEEGESTNGAQIYIEHDFVGSGESISISSGGLFSTYSKPTDLPSPNSTGNEVIGLVGYGGNKSGSNLRFARIVVRSPNILETKELIIRFNTSDLITSKIADADTSENILISVNTAVYTVKAGFCEFTSPKLINVDPANQKPNHPVGDPIFFQISDTGGSGVDIDTLDVSVTQDAWTGGINVTPVKINDNLYSVTVTQDTDFIAERKVTWSVSVSDVAGNNRFSIYYFNDLSCEELGCTGGSPVTDCADGKDNDGDGLVDDLDPGCQNEEGIYNPEDDSEYEDNVCDPEECVELKDCSDGKDNDGDGYIDNGDSGCYLSGEYNPEDNNEFLAECNDGIDNDGDGDIDYPNDSGCSSYDDNLELSCSGTEICDSFETQCQDGIDNDNDGFIDLADDGCENSNDNNEYVYSDGDEPVDDDPIYLVISQCQDGIDNDGDGLIDIADNDCENSEDNSEYHLPAGAVLDTGDLRIFLANRTISTRLTKYNSVSVLAGGTLGISVITSKIPNSIKSAKLYFKDTSYDLYFDQGSGMYIVDILAPNMAGSYSALIKLEHGEDGEEILPFSVFVLPYGGVKGDVDGEIDDISKVVVSLEQLTDDNDYMLIRSIETDQNGLYGFTVPNGAYKLTVRKNGYRENKTSGFGVSNFIVNKDFNLIKKIDLLDPEIEIGEKINYIAEIGLDSANDLRESLDDPKLEKTVEKVIAPAAIVATLAMAIPALSFLSLLSYLRFLLLLPVTILSKKKRKEWGVVYNALTKRPIDLMTVRLIDDKTDRVIQTAVTDIKGRYKFFAESGIYRIVVATSKFIYPSKVLQNINEDTSFQNIYHGAPIHIDENTSAIIQNIPIDPIGANKTPRRIIINNFLHDIRRLVIGLSLAFGAASMVIKPNLYVGILLAVQIFFYILFKKASRQTKFKNYGVIFDKDTKKPIKKAVINLYDTKFNKLITTKVTDSKGRYSFLVGNNNYYIKVEKDGYIIREITNIEIGEKDDDFIDKDIAVEKNKK